MLDPKGKFFLPVRILSRVFRGKLVELVKKSYSQHKFNLKGNLSHLENPREFERLISKATKHDFVVYAKRPFSGPETVVKYLARYTHRVAISYKRIKSVTQDEVQFWVRGKHREDKRRIVSLSPEKFTERFLLHILPKRYKRIRYYGFMYNEGKAAALANICKQLNFIPPKPAPSLTKLCTLCNTYAPKLRILVNPHRNLQQVPRLTTKPSFFCLSPPLGL